MIGHRGAAAEAPENTLASIRQAAASGARWVEFDVKLTADGVPILMHDARLERTTTGRGPVAATPFDAIQALDAGGWFGQRFAGERVPTLHDALRLCLALGLGMNVELKPCPGRAVATTEATLACLRPYETALAGRVLISCFKPECLLVAREQCPALPLGHLFGAAPRAWRAVLARHGCTTLNADHRRTGPRRLRAFRAAGATVITYTVNDPDRARKLLGAGAAAVITDRVSLISRALAAPGREPDAAQ